MPQNKTERRKLAAIRFFLKIRHIRSSREILGVPCQFTGRSIETTRSYERDGNLSEFEYMYRKFFRVWTGQNYFEWIWFEAKPGGIWKGPYARSPLRLDTISGSLTIEIPAFTLLR